MSIKKKKRKKAKVGNPLAGIAKSPCCTTDTQNLISTLQRENKLLAVLLWGLLRDQYAK